MHTLYTGRSRSSDRCCNLMQKIFLFFLITFTLGGILYLIIKNIYNFFAGYKLKCRGCYLIRIIPAPRPDGFVEEEGRWTRISRKIRNFGAKMRKAPKFVMAQVLNVISWPKLALTYYRSLVYNKKEPAVFL
ncbi:unnamed protein product [Bursaphelenchus xylophilus]|nr:unnamed protein product [Bursaphelenchus xylophilus]CAG9113445.1 unnamed protein product [Bursaphelenchus xylophilus]